MKILRTPLLPRHNYHRHHCCKDGFLYISTGDGSGPNPPDGRTTGQDVSDLLGVKLGDIAKLNIKDDVILTTADGQVHHVPFEAVDEIARPACMACPDFANDFADISVGGLGSPDGYTTTVIRTSLGMKLYNGAKQDRMIKELRFGSKEKARLHRTELMAKITAFTRRKKIRARATLARVKQAG